MNPFAKALRSRVNRDPRTQEAIAADLGCSYATLQSWMSGARTPRAMAVVAIESTLGLERGTLEKDAKKLSRKSQKPLPRTDT